MENLEKEAIRLIDLKIREKGIKITELSTKIGMHPNSLAKMIASGQIKLDRLKLIS
jgi:lambda repressor-like predicted transcriptional regulator